MKIFGITNLYFGFKTRFNVENDFRKKEAHKRGRNTKPLENEAQMADFFPKHKSWVLGNYAEGNYAQTEITSKEIKLFKAKSSDYFKVIWIG